MSRLKKVLSLKTITEEEQKEVIFLRSLLIKENIAILQKRSRIYGKFAMLRKEVKSKNQDPFKNSYVKNLQKKLMELDQKSDNFSSRVTMLNVLLNQKVKIN